MTSFVGRHSELSTLRRLLSDARLVSLIGPGGIGKSRLAIELARNLDKQYADGIWWVDLTSTTDPADLPGAIASALPLHGAGPAAERIVSWLAHKSALLVLDNCEQLVGSVAQFTEACLKRDPNLTIVATSREALGVAGETRLLIGPMNAEEAVTLFEERRLLVQPKSHIADSDREVVEDICNRLDNLPLAIEMAAARLDMMTEADLLANLTDRFRVLRAGTRSAPERHQALVATIDWSYRLLREDESKLFRRVSVFRGGFTLNGAQAVCADHETSVLEALGGLVRKSMVIAERTEMLGTRYRLLESLRAYAESALHETGDAPMTLRKHYEYFSLVIAAPPGGSSLVSDPVADEASKRAELENFYAAVTWARDNTDDMGMEMATKVAYYPFGDIASAQRRLLDLLDRSPADGKVRIRV